MSRKEEEIKVVGLMIRLYCRAHHGSCKGTLCADCEDLLRYASERIDRCPKGERKRSCRVCEIHCYAPARRQKISEVMRYAGPRMLFAAPVAAIRHLLREHSRKE